MEKYFWKLAYPQEGQANGVNDTNNGKPLQPFKWHHHYHYGAFEEDIIHISWNVHKILLAYSYTHMSHALSDEGVFNVA